MASSSPRHEVIDVGSDAPAQFQGRGRRALTLDGADAEGHYDDGNGDATSRSDEEDDAQDESLGDDDDDDDDDTQSAQGEEHTYRRGRQAIPMDSPGDELRNDLLIDEEEEDADAARRSAGVGVQRLRRLRGRRGFFHSDADVRSFRYRSSGGILQRITLRRRKKREDHDVFWTAIGLLTLLSFALMSCITIYLTQTDFFESHQNDLFGTTVDNRFTVVAQDKAQIFLKSGYSNTVYSEGMITFDDGELRIGRRAVESEESKSFFGVVFFPNGTSSFTHRVDSPMIEADYLSARKGVVFDDGTMMTTAANSSGGVKEQGDLNLVSRTGTVVTSAGGKSLLFVDPAGTVTVANTKSERPTSTGITLDGTHGTISIGNGLTIKHDQNSSSVLSPQALNLDTDTLFVGSSTSDKVRISVPDGAGNSDEDDGARALEAEESKSVTLEVVGQTSSTQKEGGDVRILGGNGDSKLELFSSSITVGSEASEVSLAGKSIVLDAMETLVVGKQADEVSIGGDEVGNVNLQGEAVSLSGASTINGTSLSVQSTKINIGSKSTSDIRIGAPGAKVDIGSKAKDLTIGVESSTIDIGSDASVVNLYGSITVNGKSLDSRRLAAESNVWSENRSKRFGYLNADRVSVLVTPTTSLTTFALHWDIGYSSEPEAYRVDTHRERLLSILPVTNIDGEDAGHLLVSLQISSVVLALNSEDAAAMGQTSKIRCRVYRHRTEQSTMPDVIALECSVASNVAGELLLKDAQYYFTEQ
ncbi:uncharacterized protein IUM83_04273 [Phytophthora cinnamomi]|uniref:uncharacterized protein n=1 Tax=Phytophthora cinnamomi TaxID=4785 RepID=UPI0035596278|nr:hypothetical protein IUM83_04273 [Phytophthora cinnamomi]